MDGCVDEDRAGGDPRGRNMKAWIVMKTCW
jgi:hypothetical protein